MRCVFDLTEANLDIKFPTVRTDGRAEEKRSEKRVFFLAGSRKGKNIAKLCLFHGLMVLEDPKVGSL